MSGSAELATETDLQNPEDLIVSNCVITNEYPVPTNTVNGDVAICLETAKRKDGFLDKLKKKFSTKKKHYPPIETPDKNSNMTVSTHEPSDVRRRGFWRRSFGAGNKRQRASVMLMPTSTGGEDEGLNLVIKARSNSESNLATATDHPAATTQLEDISKPKEIVKKMVACPPRYWRLAAFGWYWGPLTRPQASGKLLQQPNGSFLVRDSERDFNRFTLSFQAGGQTLHHRITTNEDGRYTFLAGESFDSVWELIENARVRSQDGVYCISRSAEKVGEQHEVRLLYPVTRFEQVRSLRYLCRFLIRNYTPYDCLGQLAIPSKLHDFLQIHDYYL